MLSRVNRIHCPRVDKHHDRLWVVRCPSCGVLGEEHEWPKAVRIGVIHTWCLKDAITVSGP